VIKVRLHSKAHVGHYANSWDCLRKGEVLPLPVSPSQQPRMQGD
jgi:hypothetical protein